MTTYINSLNVTAENFDIEAFSEIVNNVRRTQKVIATSAETRTELEEKLKVAADNLQNALLDGDYDAVQKFTAEAKRTKAKLEENPALKVQEFDEAIESLAQFCQPREEAQVVDFDRAVGE